MATAFSYSGTGLESAIATGSGGISSTATSVEVDAIPSDLSAGDTVKIALGTATNFANGNGETAHGDIATIGGGANGGTDITGLSRGQEGTTAASWSEGDPVRVGVQGREDAGPERPFVQSSLSIPGKRSQAYADFDAQNQNADGYEIASGQALTVESGSASIEDKALKLDASTNNTFVTLSRPHQGGVIRARILKNFNGARPYVIGAWVDSSNYVLLGAKDFNGFEIIQTIAGSSTQEESTDDTASSKSPAEYVVGFSKGYLSLEVPGFGSQIHIDNTFKLDGNVFDPSNDNFGFGCTSGVAYVTSFSMFGPSKNESAIT
jgi:hypothetical protein